jgi:hypothetical protein
MPAKVEILNSSSVESVTIKLDSIDSKNEQNANIRPNSSSEFVVKGGTKILKVYSEDGTLWWKGIIPSYGSFPIKIDASVGAVTYGGRVVVNFLKNTVSECGISSLMLATIIFVILILLLVLILKK